MITVITPFLYYSKELNARKDEVLATKTQNNTLLNFRLDATFTVEKS